MHNWALYRTWAKSASLHTIASWFLADEQTGCNWYDKLKRRWRIGAEMTDYISATGCSWADSQADKLSSADSKVDKWQLSWQIAPELRYDSWADISRPSWQSTYEETDYSSANMLQLKCQPSSELTGCSWADGLQLSWQLSWRGPALSAACFAWHVASLQTFVSASNPSSEGSLQLRLWMAFRLILVVSFVACPFLCNE